MTTATAFYQIQCNCGAVLSSKPGEEHGPIVKLLAHWRVFHGRLT